MLLYYKMRDLLLWWLVGWTGLFFLYPICNFQNGHFTHTAACFCIPIYKIQQRDLSVLLYYLIIMYHDLIFLLICGVIFGKWLWFICLSSFLIMSSILSTVLEFHKKEEIGNSRVLPRKTFLDDE